MHDFNVSQYAVSYKENEILLCGSNMEKCMFLILNGRVGIYKAHSKGETVVTELSGGEFVGAVAYFSSIEEEEKVVAMEDTMAIRIDEDNIDHFITSNPNTIIKLMASLSEELRIANESFTQSGLDEVVYKEGVDVAPPDIMEGRMFPTGHLKYPQKIDKGHFKFLFDKRISCPICEKDFSIYQIRRSKLKLIENRRDFRKVYEGFDESWYDIWVCPHCHYANFHYEFFKVSGLQKLNLKQTLLLVDHQTGKREMLKKNYGQVFQDYYLALACKTVMKSSSYEMARLWLRLAWLYQDCNHNEMYKMAYSQARQYYCDGWLNTTRSMDIGEEQKLCVLIGELYLAEKDYNNAKKYFFMGIKNKVGNKAMNIIARNRLEDVKELEAIPQTKV